MKLIEITKQILNEAAPKNPLSLFRAIFKAAGINFAEVEAALLLGLKQIDPKIVSLTKATPEQIERAFKTTAFRKYSQTIARNYIANNDKLIESILKKHPINTTTGSKAARLEIANTLGVNKSIADDIFVIKKPKKVKVNPSVPTQTPPTSNTSVGNATELSIKYDFVNKELDKLDEYLWNRVNNRGLKRFFLLKRVSRSNWSSYRNELFNHLNKTLSERFEKETKLKLTEVKEFFENLDLNDKKGADKIINDSVKKFNEILNKQAESLGAYGSIFKKLQPDVVTSFRNWLSGKGTFDTFKKDYVDAFKMSSAFMAFGTIGELLAGDLNSWEKIKDEINLKYATIAIPGMNTWFWGLNALYRWGKVIYNLFNKDEKKSGESGLFNDTDIKTDTEEDKLKRIEGGNEN